MKIRVPHRDQIEMRCESLDQLLRPEHPARAAWEFAGRLDLIVWSSRILSTHGGSGSPAIDRRVLASRTGFEREGKITS